MQLAGLGDLKIGRMRLLKRSSGEGSAERAGVIPVTSTTRVAVVNSCAKRTGALLGCRWDGVSESAARDPSRLDGLSSRSVAQPGYKPGFTRGVCRRVRDSWSTRLVDLVSDRLHLGKQPPVQIAEDGADLWVVRADQVVRFGRVLFEVVKLVA
jgi:hypothetical protein